MKTMNITHTDTGSHLQLRYIPERLQVLHYLIEAAERIAWLPFQIIQGVTRLLSLALLGIFGQGLHWVLKLMNSK